MANNPGSPPAAGLSPPPDPGTLLDGLLPPFARAVAAQVTGCCASPFPEERDAVAGAAPARRREFLGGRACAHAALRALDRDDGDPIGIEESREPSWPAGVVGSISHAGSFAAAVVARAKDARGLGLDIEVLDPPLEPEVRRLILTPGELSRLEALEALEPRAAKILFSAKESVYKCVFPPTRWRLVPQEVDIALDVGRRRFRAVIAEASHGGQLPALTLEGTFRLVGRYVVTGVHM